MSNGNEYIIVGDTEKYDECLVTVCGAAYDDAVKVLERMTNTPTQNDLALMKGHTNLRIKEVEKEDCWWLQGGLD